MDSDQLNQRNTWSASGTMARVVYASVWLFIVTWISLRFSIQSIAPPGASGPQSQTPSLPKTESHDLSHRDFFYLQGVTGELLMQTLPEFVSEVHDQSVDSELGSYRIRLTNESTSVIAIGWFPDKLYMIGVHGSHDEVKSIVPRIAALPFPLSEADRVREVIAGVLRDTRPKRSITMNGVAVTFAESTPARFSLIAVGDADPMFTVAAYEQAESKRASEKLFLAKALRGRHRAESDQQLKRIVERFPATPAALEAQEIIDKQNE